MNNKKVMIICFMFLLAYALNVKAVQVLDRKVISERATDCDMHWAKLILNNDNSLTTMRHLLYNNNNLTRTYNQEKCCCNILGGVIKGNQFYVVLDEEKKGVNTYKVQNRIEFESYIKPVISEFHRYHGVILLPEQDNCYYLFGHYTLVAFGPFDSLEKIVSSGNTTFKKPFLAKVRNNKIEKIAKIDYGGKRNESYVVQEAVAGKDSIHLFGFRNVDVPFMDNGRREPIKLVDTGIDGYGGKQYDFDGGNYYGDRDITRSIILYYADYDLKKQKNMRKYTIYENIPGYNEKTDIYSDYGVLSADSQDDNVYTVFSWNEVKKFKQGSRYRQPFDINNVSSSIYFWQCSSKSYGKAEKIAEGFCPLVRVDQFGIVHVFWLDHSGNVVQKNRKDGKWSDEEIILNDFSTKKSIIYTKSCIVETDKERPEAILYTKFFTAEFDSENNLHAVYPAENGIIYTKIKLE